MDGHPLLTSSHVEEAVPEFLGRVATIFRVFDRQDSGCISYGVYAGGRRWFVKTSVESRAIPGLRNAQQFHGVVRHRRIPSLVNTITAAGGPALVYEWVEGEILSSPEFGGRRGRSRPESPHFRFVNLPPFRILAVLDAIYELHTHTEQMGYVAVDFYDGCIIYDFDRHDVRFCDFDHYHPGPFVLEDERLPGSSRFMAPEESTRGSVIDRCTNVYTMGAAAFVLLAGTSRDPGDWRGPGALWEVARRAASPERGDRYPSVRDLYRDWVRAR